MTRQLIGLCALILLPFLYVVFNIFGGRVTIMQLLTHWNEHRKSGEDWGVLG